MGVDETSNEQPKSITVSRDALRADLLEMELRLRTYFDTALALKASQLHMDDVESRLKEQEIGEFTEAQTLKIADIVDKILTLRARAGFTARERKIALFGILFAGVSTLTSLFLAARGIWG